jgi:hypothetical protein
MNLKKFGIKKSLVLLMCFLIFDSAYAQQNTLGLTNGTKGNLTSINLHYFASGQATEIPDNIINISVANTYQMHEMGFPQLNYYIYNDIRVEAGKLFVSSVGSEERIINVSLIKNAESEEKWGRAALSCEYAQPVEIDFFYEHQQKILKIQYLVSEKDNMNYMQEREAKIAAGQSPEEIEKYEQSKPAGIYLVSIIYSIK